MLKKIIGTTLIAIIVISINGCSFNMPVVANNPGEKWICKDNRIIIDVANNTPKNRLNIPKAVEEALLEKYSNQKDTSKKKADIESHINESFFGKDFNKKNIRKKHVYTENYSEHEERCRKTSFAHATNMSALEAAQIRYNNCMDLSGPRTYTKFTGSSTSIHKQNYSDEDILLGYYIETKDDSEVNSFDFTIKVDGDFIVIYLVGRNGCKLPQGISYMISNIVREHDEQFLALKHYKL